MNETNRKQIKVQAGPHTRTAIQALSLSLSLLAPAKQVKLTKPSATLPNEVSSRNHLLVGAEGGVSFGPPSACFFSRAFFSLFGMASSGVSSQSVSAHTFCDTLVRLAPEHADTILAIARQTGLELRQFCAAVRREIGGTLLFDAVLAMRGSQLPARSHADVVALVEHCVRCRSPGCTRADCLALRSMLSVMKMHAAACAVPAELACQTCDQWHTMRSKMLAARRGMKTARCERVSGEGSTGSNDAGAALLMHLARSALVDLPPTSPRLSPVNSPSNSPSTSPMPKRPKADGKSRAAAAPMRSLPVD